MRPCTQSLQLAALALALAGRSYGQSHQSPPPAPASTAAADENKITELPTRPLVFAPGDSVSGFKLASNIILPLQCSSDGTLFFDVLPPPTFMEQALFAVTPKSSRSFELSAINNLHGVQLISFFPGNDHVSLLVRATRETSPLPREATVRQSSYGFFVALFNRQGEYLQSVELAIHGIQPSHVAALTSGEYLVTGYDRANDIPRLYLVADDGQVIRTLVLPYDLGQYVPSSDPNSAKAMMNEARVLGSILMTAHGDEVLVWRRGGRGPILSVGAHGSTREINLDVPRGLSLVDVLPSDKSWVAQFQEVQHENDQEHDLRKTSYYLFDPSDGSLTSKLSFRGDAPEHTPASIACEEEGTFLSYQRDDKGQTRILSAR